MQSGNMNLIYLQVLWHCMRERKNNFEKPGNMHDKLIDSGIKLTI